MTQYLHIHTDLITALINLISLASQTVFTTIHFLCNLQMGLISWSVIKHKVEKACRGQTLQLIGLTHKLRRKLSAVNQTPGACDRKCSTDILNPASQDSRHVTVSHFHPSLMCSINNVEPPHPYRLDYKCNKSYIVSQTDRIHNDSFPL